MGLEKRQYVIIVHNMSLTEGDEPNNLECLGEDSFHVFDQEMELDLLEESPEQWFQKFRPDWDDNMIARAVGYVELGRLIGEYEDLKNNVSGSSDQKHLEWLNDEIKIKREFLENNSV